MYKNTYSDYAAKRQMPRPSSAAAQPARMCVSHELTSRVMKNFKGGRAGSAADYKQSERRDRAYNDR